MNGDTPHVDRERLLRLRQLGAAASAVAATLLLFLILPFTQTISRPPVRDLELRAADFADVPPPPPPPEEEEEKKPEEEKPPELQPETQPLDLEQLELALNPGFGDGWGGDYAVKLASALGGGDDLDKIFSLQDLDQKPRVIFQTPPVYPPELRSRGVQGTVYITFIVDKTGRVQNPTVEKTTDPRFDRPALDAIRQWRFEPGMRNGTEVQFKMRVPITFSVS
jgi:protein TonB